MLASMWGVIGLLNASGMAQAQTAASGTSIRQADFIVAVVNSEPITNRDVQVLRQRLAKEAASQGSTRPDTHELNRLALEQLINEKAQMQQAREAGIKIDNDAIDQAELNVAKANDMGSATLSFAPQPSQVLIGIANVPDSNFGR